MLYFYLGTLLALTLGSYFLIPVFKKHVPKNFLFLKKVKEIEEAAPLAFQANIDNLTGLFNHRYFSCQLEKMLNDAKKTNCPLSLVVLDTNDFKYYNQVFGRSKGDMILQKTGEKIRQLTPQSGVAARIGGGEFLLILPGFDTKKAQYLAEHIVIETESLFSRKEKVTFSAGIACCPDTALNKQSLIDYAYQELYRQKRFVLNKLSTYHWVVQSIKENSENSYDPHVFAQFFLLTINLKDHYTLSHTNSVLKYTEELGSTLSLSPKDLRQIKIGALFHDVGKIQVPEQVLMKAGPLTEEEWHSIQRHPHWSGEILSSLIKDETAVSLVKHHHERFDGKGYPDGLAGDQIPLGARIIALADSFSAMITPRPYRDAITISQALIEVKKNSGTQFDPKIVDTLVHIINTCYHKE